MVVDSITQNNTVIDVGDGNRIITGTDCVLSNSKIIFNGRNNILKMGGRSHIRNSTIEFGGNESLAVLSTNCHDYYLNLVIYHNSVFYMGENNFLNGRLSIILSEQKHVFFGSGSAISFGIWIRTADPHLIYDAESGRRINSSRSVFVGDHVWIGQGALLLKGTQIGSGCIIGAESVVAGKRIPSNTAWAGNPVRKVKDRIFWSGQCVHPWKDEETEKYQTMETDQFYYERNEMESCPFDMLDEKFSACDTAEKKLEYLSNLRKEKNRFYIGNKDGNL